MTEPRPQVLLAYDRVIRQVKSIYAAEHGTEFGALRWFVGELGISPQTLDNWKKRAGIVPAYVDRVAKITGMKPDQIRPDTLLIEVPKKAWNKLAPKELVDQATIHSTVGRKYG